MGNRRVVVTGVGVISALGRNCGEFWAALCEGRSGIRPIEAVPRDRLGFANGAEVGGFDPREEFDEVRLALLDRFAQFGLVAAWEAVRAAGVAWTDELRDRAAVVTGTCVGGQASNQQVFDDLYLQDRRRAHPFTIPRVMPNAAAGHISLEFGIRGPVYTVTTACSSGTHAIGQAFELVRSGKADLALAGGSDSPFSLGFLKAWEALRVVAPDTCRPFARGRRGMILGEGGAMLVLEPLAAARARGAEVLAEVVGFGMTADAYHITLPSVEGPARAMRQALADARLSPAEVGYVNAHGTGTAANDVTEARAIREVFGPAAAGLAVSSTKSMHGHALGAAGAIEAVATVLALRHGVLPPTANFTEPDPDCDLDVVPNRARPAAVGAALSNSFAFGGLNAVLAFRRAEPNSGARAHEEE
jgi:nodulation protein E